MRGGERNDKPLLLLPYDAKKVLDADHDERSDCPEDLALVQKGRLSGCFPGYRILSAGMDSAEMKSPAGQGDCQRGQTLKG